MFKKWREAKRERLTHNDRDFKCIYWWGDRSGSLVGVCNEVCKKCT